MKKAIKIEKIRIPKYSLGEELISSISHGIGFCLSIAALVLCIVASAHDHSATAVIASIIYGLSLMILYLISTLYHAFKPNGAKRVFRVLDHSSVFLLIAGSYTPYCLLIIPGPRGLILLAIIWTLALIGIIGDSININKFEHIAFPLYILMGWAIVFSLQSLKANLLPLGLLWLTIGGVLYTIGALIYLVGIKVKYMHSIFHFFVLGGSIFQFFSIFLYVL